MILSIILGLVMISFGLKKKKPNIIMGFAFLFLGHGIFLVLLIDSGLMPNFPIIYRTGNLAGLLYVALTFLYFEQTLFPSKFKVWKLLYFLPALIYFIDFLPVFALSSAEKLDLILEEIEDPNLFVEFNQSRFFSGNFYTGFRNVVNLIFWSMSISLVIKFRRNKTLDKSNADVLKWVQGYLFFQILLFLPFYFTFFIDNPEIIFRVTHFAGALLCIFSSVYLLYFPKVLYGFTPFKQPHESLVEEKEKPKDSKIKETLDPEKIEEVRQKLETLMRNKKVYLFKGYTSHDLAKDGEIPYYVLTSYLNHSLGTNFPDYINGKRISYCLDLIESGKVEHLTLEGIGEMCGFNNRNSFGVAFKKVTGQTPSVFIKAKKG